MKKNSRFVISLISLFSLLSCAKNKENVSILIYDINDSFINCLWQKITNRLSNEGYDVKSYDCQRSQNQQNKYLLEAIEKNKASLLLVNLVDRLTASVTIEKAIQKETPLIFFNREPLSKDLESGIKEFKNIYYVGTNPRFEGEKQAEMLYSAAIKEGKLLEEYDKNKNGVLDIVLLKGEIGNQDTEGRSEAFINKLKSLSLPFVVLESTYANWQKDKGKLAMEEMYKKHGQNIEALISNNDDMALGAIDYLLEQGIFKEEEEKGAFPVFAVDGLSSSLSYIKKGFLTGTVKNNDIFQSEAICSLANYLLKNQEIPPQFPYKINSNHTIYIEGNIINKENLE